MKTLSALFVQSDGVYSTMPDVDLWPESRDARTYSGPLPVVAHPPCQRWGKFWHGSTARPHQFKLGSDGGCFASALWSVRTFGKDKTKIRDATPPQFAALLVSLALSCRTS